MKKIKNQNNIGDVFDVKSAVCREFDTTELSEGIRDNIPYQCGFSNPEVVKRKKCISFNVSGNVHKGKVYIVLNFLDLFNVYYCDDNDIIKNKSVDVFIFDLILILNENIYNKTKNVIPDEVKYLFN